MDFYKKRKFDLKGKNIKIPIMAVFMAIMIQALIGTISYKMLFNLNAFQIIFAGIFISIFISFPMEVLINTVNSVKDSFTEEIDYEQTINKVYNLSIKIKKEGLLSIQSDIEYEDDIFLRDAMILLNDYKRTEVIADIMDNDIESRHMELFKPYNVMKMVANISPAFGLVGTLVGMIGLLAKLNSPQEIMGNMAYALVSTLYGSLVSNFIAFPLMARIQEQTEQRLLQYRMIKEGILLISKDDSTRNVFDKMNVMLKENKRLVYPRDYSQERDYENYEFKEF
ncbi:MotA/TolQ/ExbB proton channel family protein [Tissierella sp.]|uniref:motility protein A n=1 Tax=Tissierella sp. TaxID=41274 RepID=UPI002855860D|nr:MotA/TolQ/ExbB proton channel family protein [Tissierella sp.]MDR7856509.1 MotA/TolQ/ExbB proton channel family protein [Tissierella sp.]